MNWLGMNANSGRSIADIDHIRQSIHDILTTPRGSRVMRRDYGSDLFYLIDQPQTPALRLQIMAAVIIALTEWEPRVRVSQIDIEPAQANGRSAITLTTNRVDSGRDAIYQVTV